MGLSLPVFVFGGNVVDSLRITSIQNQQLKMVKRLQRKKHRDGEGLFLLEGVRIVEEALPTGLLQSVFYLPRLLEQARGESILSAARRLKIPLRECSPSVFGQLSDTVQSQGVLAVVAKPSWPVMAAGGVYLVADGISDPGNLGSLVRNAVAAGAAGLFLAEGSVDLYNPKVLRATMGAVFHLPHWVLSRKEIIDLCRARGFPLVLADLEGAEDYWSVAYPADLAVVIGNEARGIHPLFRRSAELRVAIPLVGPVESLNAAAASAVLLYEILRQRRCNSPDSVL